MGNTEGNLNEYRQRIDEFDRQIIELLNERAGVVSDIGRLKCERGAPTYAPDREREVLNRIKQLNAGPLSERTLVAIYRELMSGSFVLERPPRVAYLGPQGSFSHLAALRKFGASIDYEPVRSIAAVFDELEREHVDLGLVPVENSSGGGVVDTLDALVRRDVLVCAEVYLSVHLHLFGLTAVEDIETLYSKPEALAQCQKWLAQTGLSEKTIAVSSTAKAAEQASGDPQSACVGSELVGRLHGLTRLRDRIEDNPSNVTRFLVLGRTPTERTGADKTSICFSTVDKPGALVEVLDTFRTSGTNMTYIESRPNQQRNWEYVFFVDLEGHLTDASVVRGTSAAREHCRELRVLGSFPKAQEIL
ncbi:MAG: prephenate dehydratase [bacterium]|nr:prephenate dehydratase [bacterium]